jgi:hypothetical protein
VHESPQPSGRAAAPRAALAVTGGVVLGALALTETFGEMAPAVGAYAAAWWVLGLAVHAPEGSAETT